MDDGTIVDSLIPKTLIPMDSLKEIFLSISYLEDSYVIGYRVYDNNFLFSYKFEIRELKTHDTLFFQDFKNYYKPQVLDYIYTLKSKFYFLDYNSEFSTLLFGQTYTIHLGGYGQYPWWNDGTYGGFEIFVKESKKQLSTNCYDEFSFNKNRSKLIFNQHIDMTSYSKSRGYTKHTVGYNASIINFKDISPKNILKDGTSSIAKFTNPSISPSGETIIYGDTSKNTIKVKNFELTDSLTLILNDQPIDNILLSDSIMCYLIFNSKDSIYTIINHNYFYDRIMKMVSIPSYYKLNKFSLKNSFYNDLLLTTTNFKLLRLNYDTLVTELNPEFYSKDTIQYVNKDVQFFNLSWSKFDKCIWDFGDGDTSSTINPFHFYKNPGLYRVSLELFKGDSSAKMIKNNYMKILPGIKANFEIQQSTGLDTLNVIISNTSSGPITSYKWFIGDSIFTVKEPSFTIYKPGYYDVTLIVSDGFYYDTLTKVDYLNIIQSPISSEYIQKFASFSSDISHYIPKRIIRNKNSFLILINKNISLDIISKLYSIISLDSNFDVKFVTNEFYLKDFFDDVYMIDDTTFYFTKIELMCINSNNSLYKRDLILDGAYSQCHFETITQDQLGNIYYVFDSYPPRFVVIECVNFYTGKFESVNKYGWDIGTISIEGDFYEYFGSLHFNTRIYSHNHTFFFFESFIGKYRDPYDKSNTIDDSGNYCHFSKITKLSGGSMNRDWLVKKKSMGIPLNFHVLNDQLFSFVIDNSSYKEFNKIVNYKIGKEFTYSKATKINNYYVTFPYNDSLFLAGGSINGKATLFFLSIEDLEIKKTITLNSLYGNITSIERASDGEFLLLAENKINKKFDSFLALKTKNLGKDAYPVSVDLGNEPPNFNFSNLGKYLPSNSLSIYYSDEISNPTLEIYDFMGRKLVSTNELDIDTKTKKITCDLSQFGDEITERAIYFYILRDSGNLIRGKFMR